MANNLEKRIAAAQREAEQQAEKKRKADERLRELLREDKKRKELERKRQAERNKIARDKVLNSLGAQMPEVVKFLKHWEIEGKDGTGRLMKASVYDMLCGVLPDFAKDMAKLDALNGSGLSSPAAETPGASDEATRKPEEATSSNDTQARSDALKAGE